MKSAYMNKFGVPVLVAAILALSACGESDLHTIHEKEIDDAIAADEPSGANPDPDGQPSNGIDLSDYELVFSDEFNSDSIDETKWDTTLWSSDTVIYNQLQFYVDIQDDVESLPSPFSLDGANLRINASKTPDEMRAAANEQPYLSGLLTTRNRFDFKYGYVEARVRVTEGRGIWPSLWMLGSDTEGLNPEVYILEYDGSRADSVFHNYNYVDSDGELRSPGQQEVQMPGFSEEFHSVGVLWSPEELMFYIDGKPSYRIVGEKVPAEDMYLVLNLAMGGLWTGSPDATTPDPATLIIDYVRAYQLISTDGSSTDDSLTDSGL